MICNLRRCYLFSIFLQCRWCASFLTVLYFICLQCKPNATSPAVIQLLLQCDDVQVSWLLFYFVVVFYSVDSLQVSWLVFILFLQCDFCADRVHLCVNRELLYIFYVAESCRVQSVNWPSCLLSLLFYEPVLLFCKEIKLLIRRWFSGSFLITRQQELLQMLRLYDAIRSLFGFFLSHVNPVWNRSAVTMVTNTL